MVTKFVPLPDNDGGKQRALAVATRLARGAEVVLCAYDDGDGDVAGTQATRHRRAQRPVASHRVARRARRGADPQCLGGPVLQRRARRRGAPGRHRGIGSTSLQVEYLQMVPVVRGVAAERRVLDLHNVESALRAQLRPGRQGAGRDPGARRGRRPRRHGAGPRARVRHRRGGERERTPPPARRRRPRPRLSQRPGPRPAGTAPARADPHGRLRRHHGMGAQRRRRPVVRGGGVARGARVVRPTPASCSSAGTPPPRCGPSRPRRSRYPVPFPTSARTSPRREWRWRRCDPEGGPA